MNICIPNKNSTNEMCHDSIMIIFTGIDKKEKLATKKTPPDTDWEHIVNRLNFLVSMQVFPGASGMSWHTGPLPKRLILQSVQESACVKKKVYKTHQSKAEPSMKSPNAYSVRTSTLPATAALTPFDALICCDIYTEIQHGLITHH